MRLLRTVRGWSQETLAMNAGLDRTFVGAIERAERNLALATAEKIANVFQLSVADLLSPHTSAALLNALTWSDKTSNQLRYRLCWIRECSI
ncbi:MAG TPA: XRE family transcriptional regulator [Gammaproteobacteria bacterium]|nr:XRE family transcriptional regulator [Gammaproteobacteria bacterium]